MNCRICNSDISESMLTWRPEETLCDGCSVEEDDLLYLGDINLLRTNVCTNVICIQCPHQTQCHDIKEVGCSLYYHNRSLWMDMSEYSLEDCYVIDDLFELPHYGKTKQQVRMDNIKETFINILTEKLAEKGMKLELCNIVTTV